MPPVVTEVASGMPTQHVLAPLAYTLADATALCGLSRSTLCRHAAAGRLRLVKVGGRTLVDADSLRNLIGGGV